MSLLGAGIVALALAVPPPCTEEELLGGSTAAIEGHVLDVALGAPRDSGECEAGVPPDPGYRPEMVADGVASIEVVRSIKGDHEPGEIVGVPFLALVDACRGGEPLIPGSPKKDFRPGSRVRWYDAPGCAWSNLIEVEPPFLRGDATEDGAVDLADAVRALEALFSGGPEPAVPSAMDSNGDGSADIADPIYILFHLFAGGPPPPAPFPFEAVRIAVAFANEPIVDDIVPGWGFSGLIVSGEERVLMDSGPDGAALLRNLEAMAIDPAGIGRFVFSHIHDDHVKGAAALLGATGPAPVWIPESFPDSFRSTVRPLAASLIEVAGPIEVAPGILSTGELPGSPKEQSLIVQTARGIVLVVACAHGGAAATVEEAKRQAGGAAVELLVGGLHLFRSSDADVRAAIAELRRLGVRRVAPGHCTGGRAIELLREEYGAGCLPIETGARFLFRR